MTTPVARRGLDVAAVRAHFPALARLHDGVPVAYLDGPGGTQVPRECIGAISAHLAAGIANTHGAFDASAETDALLADAHAATADFLGAHDPDEIVFGPNMTTLTLAVSRALGRDLQPGDEVVVTRLDHDANVAPWLAVAEDRGATVRWVDINEDDCTLDLDGLADILGERTRIVAVGLASNAVGTISDVGRVVELAHAAGAIAYIDAVHAAPHLPIDVQAIGTDFLACSTYKFFGPHAGVLYGRQEILDALPAYKLRPASDRFETGTGNFEGLAGVTAAVAYLADIGVAYGGARADRTRRERVLGGMGAIRNYELELYRRLAAGLTAVPGLTLYGITDPTHFDERTPTAALTLDGVAPRAAAEALGDEGIAVWDGDFYATGLIERLGLADRGGVVRIGLTHYNTADEVDRLIEALGRIATGAGSGSTATPVAAR